MTAGLEQLGAAAALSLGAVFGWAALAKARNPTSTVTSIRGLGLPAPAAVAIALVGAECALAVGLVVRPAVAAPYALAALGLFTLVLARAVRRGATVGCACFGSVNTRAVSGVDLIRNTGLIAIALIASLAPVREAAVGVLSLPAIVVVTVAFALGRVGLAVAELRQIGGRVFAIQLAGEQRR